MRGAWPRRVRVEGARVQGVARWLGYGVLAVLGLLVVAVVWGALRVAAYEQAEDAGRLERKAAVLASMARSVDASAPPAQRGGDLLRRPGLRRSGRLRERRARDPPHRPAGGGGHRARPLLCRGPLLHPLPGRAPDRTLAVPDGDPPRLLPDRQPARHVVPPDGPAGPARRRRDHPGRIPARCGLCDGHGGQMAPGRPRALAAERPGLRPLLRSAPQQRHVADPRLPQRPSGGGRPARPDDPQRTLCGRGRRLDRAQRRPAVLPLLRPHLPAHPAVRVGGPEGDAARRASTGTSSPTSTAAWAACSTRWRRRASPTTPS